MFKNVTAVIDSDIPPMPKFVMVCLADMSDEYGVCFPSVATLSLMTSIPERSIQRHIQWLIKKHYLEIFWGKTKKSQKLIRHFRLVLAGIPRAPRPDYSNCSQAMRREVIANFNQTCVYCNRDGDDVYDPDGNAWHVDRLIPGTRGGAYEPYNVTLSCRSCNIGKGAKTAPEDTKSLGAILDEKRCQNVISEVPSVAHEVCQDMAHESSVIPHSEESSIEKPRERERKKKSAKSSVTEYRGIKLQPERNLISWMREAAKEAGKHWRHDGRKGNRGPTWQMKDELREKENSFHLVRTWWIDFLLDNVGDEERFPYSLFLNTYYPARLDKLTDEQSVREMEKENRPEPTHAFLEDLDQQASKEPKLSDLD